MLRIFNELKPFFEDNYRRIGVREYARLQKITPPTGSEILKKYYKENLLKKERDGKRILYFANKENKVFIDLSRIYWYIRFQKIGLIEYLNQELLTPVVILFGSFSKAEVSEKSDIDIAVFVPKKKKIDLSRFEKRLKRRIQVFMFEKREEIKNPELLNNILNGYLLSGGW